MPGGSWRSAARAAAAAAGGGAAAAGWFGCGEAHATVTSRLRTATEHLGDDPIARLQYRRRSGPEEFPDLRHHHSVMAQVLTEDMYCRMHNCRTAKGWTLDRAIQTGVDNIGSAESPPMGIVAGDEESYFVFRELFAEVIRKRHGLVYGKAHDTDLNPANLSGDPLDGRYATLTRMRMSRNIRGYRLPNAVSRGERRELEAIAIAACKTLKGSLRSTYRKVSELSEKILEDYVQAGMLFPKPTSPLLFSSGFARDWPDGRGIYVTPAQDLVIQVNAEDHLRIVATQKGGDLATCFGRLCNAHGAMEKALKELDRFYMWTKEYGYLTACPGNIGTGYRCSVSLKIPNVARHPDFHSLLSTMKLRAQGSGLSGMVNVSNTERLGRTEVQLTDTVHAGCTKLIELEKAAENGRLPKRLL
eukprot:TRINITY_DN4372_c3_g1_i1.p1 TRINITY_DN4372_c3_g1~~TRINITY_DN4372_c3_g1_i1.p1  ORF type:complete len:440 (+),score=151.04 TRINITY_DN4372_c3_g1_i1:74-1321(+)